MKTAGSIFLRTHFPTPTKLLFLPLTNPKHSLSLIPISISFTRFSATNSNPILYSFSLHKGTSPTLQRPQNNAFLTLREDAFTRVFHLSAHCSALKTRLRGHLLNWPCVGNIARVPGDGLDPDPASLVTSGESGGGEEGHVSLQRRIYGEAEGDGDVLSPVLFREKLARTFNTPRFVKFRNLAKISRLPKRKKKKKEEEEEVKVERRTGKNNFATVEVVEEDDNGGGIFGNLVEEEFGREKWRGSTRLLLLDERYAGRGIQDFAEAIKVVCVWIFCFSVLKEYAKESANLTFELVRCKLTLFYNYWQMNEILVVLLLDGMVVPSAFETISHIAHLNLRSEQLPYKTLIEKVVPDKNKPKIQTVVNKIDSIHNEYRTLQLEILVGNRSLVTTFVENGICFQVDLATVYWSSRLATERQRLLSGFTRKDVVYAFRGIYKDRPKDTECNLPTIHVYGFSKAQHPEFIFTRE
ncbi:tRNA (guanine(37)-N(1))-methyltransferase 1 isoform X1 [Arachis hypogaea]|uniref:tRNA (guanine(37)-N(1))-methyltransferase 1 isoform X1 n=1 Tax=Arachis hypogaea TaxID=3818 RepID=UPI000DECB883|nr:tRNA (guanine(37)-N1)-methyltransferase 1 isoform X1 [Arachis hypogaea]XP_029148633.1 tRNA (guanine(37)-N1)-methyltransferase 1 isoform X1 [Arachis hypogaea]XP_029148635.1 tRNA (guanine(37)-N1)-methyltransferase 1 isoform X1 [Arachis hypogaea]XP_029148637.1 tRNA (guanine(37)-N1)-methyltransferase 1 isoform X1 [Arachis hypogaea]XP_029148638.1 tRNA (guanine(37)-N1)-methyltransferase 1 isoform X1 [Arachis hypogaea]XP_029148639.1 tRNA (guanine(37)-N1)-methyltransferase 1 isoform X1 [Arachis hyp